MFKHSMALIFAAASALAGPPLVCHRIEIGTAQSLPWRVAGGWDGADANYNLKNLTADTLRLLEPATPLPVRMETLRRAAIYSARAEGVADQLAARLLERTKVKENDPMGWFDAGYFVETLRQAGFIYRYDMLSEADRKQWVHRGEKPFADGLPWLQKAIQLGGKGIEPVVAMTIEYRNADLNRQKTKTAMTK